MGKNANRNRHGTKFKFRGKKKGQTNQAIAEKIDCSDHKLTSQNDLGF